MCKCKKHLSIIGENSHRFPGCNLETGTVPLNSPMRQNSQQLRILPSIFPLLLSSVSSPSAHGMSLLHLVEGWEATEPRAKWAAAVGQGRAPLWSTIYIAQEWYCVPWKPIHPCVWEKRAHHQLDETRIPKIFSLCSTCMFPPYKQHSAHDRSDTIEKDLRVMMTLNLCLRSTRSNRWQMTMSISFTSARHMRTVFGSMQGFS